MSRIRRVAWAAAMTAPLFIAVTVAAPGQTTSPGDLTLRGALERAVASYPSVMMAEATEREAAAAVGQTVSRRWPVLRVDGSAVRFAEAMIVAPLHGFEFATPPDFNRTLIQSVVSADYLLFDGGARGARVREANASHRSAEWRLHDREMEVMRATARAYLAVVAHAQLLEAHESRRTALEAERSRVRELVTEGTAPRVEQLRVEAALSAAAADRRTVREAKRVAEHDLARLAGLDAPELSALDVAAVRLTNRDPREVADLQRAARSSPRIQSADRRVAAASHAARAATASWLPEVRLTGAYQTFGSAAGEFAGEWQAGVRLSYPIFRGGERTHAVRRARAAERRADAEFELATLEAEAELDRALAANAAAAARVAALTDAATHLAEVVRIERLALSEGVGTQTEYLRAEADLLTARAQLVDATHAEITAQVDLAWLTGTLSFAWFDEYLETIP